MLSKILFTVLLLMLAGLHTVKTLNFDSISVWLGVVAALPWILPQLQQMFTSVKVQGIGEFTFRELEKKVEAQQLAIEGGVGGKAEVQTPKSLTTTAGARSQDTIEAAEEDEAPAVAAQDPDPNKGRFGSSPVRDGFRLSAEVEPFPGSDQLFQIHAWVEGTDSVHRLRTGDRVVFHLHPSFGRDVVPVEASSDGRAHLKRVAWGAFTMGAEVFTGTTAVPLELDLAQLPGAPQLFRNR